MTPKPAPRIATARSATRKKTRDEIVLLSIPLFAKSGFDGISMRDIAGAVGVTPSALYHHFQDKDSLYLSIVEHTFTEKTEKLKRILSADGDPRERLEQFITAFTRILGEEKDFQRLLHWTLLESTDARMQALADDVFLDLVRRVERLVAELKTPFDPILLTVSIMGMIMFPFEAAKAAGHIPGHRAAHGRPATLAKHIISLLRNGIDPQAAGNPSTP